MKRLKKEDINVLGLYQGGACLFAEMDGPQLEKRNVIFPMYCVYCFF